MLGVIEFPQEITLGTVTFSSTILASIWWLIYLMCRDHRAILTELRRNTGETVLSKANAFRAANTADHNAAAIGGLEDKIGVKIETAVSGGVAAVAAEARDVVAELRTHTPLHTTLPEELRVILTTEAEKPVVFTAK